MCRIRSKLARPAGEQIDHGDPDRLALADLQQGLPIVTRDELVAVSDRRPKPLEMPGRRKQGGDDAHVETCVQLALADGSASHSVNRLRSYRHIGARHTIM